MINVELDAREVAILIDVLKSAISDLRMEISGTDLLDVRDGLRERKEVLIKVLESLTIGTDKT